MRALGQRLPVTCAAREKDLNWHQGRCTVCSVKRDVTVLEAQVHATGSAFKARTKTRRVRHLANHVRLESTEKLNQAMSCIHRLPTAVSTARRANTVAPKESRAKADAMIVLPASRAHLAAWTQAKNARQQPKANTTTEKSVCRGHTKTRRVRRLASHAQLESMA